MLYHPPSFLPSLAVIHRTLWSAGTRREVRYKWHARDTRNKRVESESERNVQQRTFNSALDDGHEWGHPEGNHREGGRKLAAQVRCYRHSPARH